MGIILKLMTQDVYCHGTYIHDDPRWRPTGRELRIDEVRKLIPIPEDIQHDYLWLNKGWMVIGAGFRVGGPHRENAVIIPCNEEFAKRLEGKLQDGQPPYTAFWLQPGDKAIYLADGKYRLHEYV